MGLFLDPWNSQSDSLAQVKRTLGGRGCTLRTMSSPTRRVSFEYEPLIGEDAIRLIFLYPSQDDSAPIQCSIKHSTLSRSEHELQDCYTALSYVWGDPNDIRTIFVDRMPVQVTKSLESALRHLRKQEPGRILCLWADALCINQTDTLKKNRQVQQMGAIYATAHHTVIYLGLLTEEIDFAFDKLQLFQRRTLAPGTTIDLDGWSPEELQTAWNTLRTCVLTRPWFTRVWVFQELVLSPDPWLQCGNRRMRWDKFCEISSAIKKQCDNVANRILGTIDVTENPELDLLRPVLDMQTRRFAFHYTTTQNADDNHHNSLLDLLSLRRGLGASDIRDLVYAHLSLADDYRKESKALRVDYTLSCAQVFAEAARYMIDQGALEKVIGLAWDVETAARLPGLPSWTPDWTLAKSSGRLFPIPSNNFDTNSLDAAVSFTPWTKIPMRLFCAGWYIGSIAALSKQLSYLEIPQNEVRNVWLDVINGSNICDLTESEDYLEDKTYGQILLSLYNELLQIFEPDLQHLRIIPVGGGDNNYMVHNHNFWLLDHLKTFYEGYENIRLHPMALMSLFALGLGSLFRSSKKTTKSPDSVMEQVLVFDGNRLGLLNLRSRKANEKKRRYTMDMEGISCFAQMPFGLFPDFVEENDRICIFSGCQKAYVCRPVEKIRDEDDGEHLIILGECHINGFISSRYELKEVPVTDFIFH